MSEQIIIYEGQNGATRLEVHLEAETVWLTQDQMADLFGRERSGITKHIGNVFKEDELDEKSNVRNLHIPFSDKPTKLYNLDVIISVGYRIKSQQGTRFRQWATKVLRDHLVQGYTVNQTRLAEKGLSEMQQTVELLSRTLSNQALVTEAGQDVLSVIVGYAKTWRLLLQYDEDALALPPGCQPAKGVLGYEYAIQAIADLKQELKCCGEATDLFGSERCDALDAILGNIEQTMFGDSLYRTREEKAAHLLYFVIKDHPFLDGNKRIGSFLFLLYQRQEGMPAGINENTLTALALLIAESEPANKDLMIRLVVNLLISE